MPCQGRIAVLHLALQSMSYPFKKGQYILEKNEKSPTENEVAVVKPVGRGYKTERTSNKHLPLLLDAEGKF